MADDDRPDEREATPEQEAAVRRLLADARARDPLPADVASRLDGVLAGLRAGSDPRGGRDPVDGTATAPVVDLAARRRRRRAGALLIAAAAVVAVGVGIGQVVDTGGTDGAATSTDTGAAGADRLEEDAEGAAPDEAPPSVNAVPSPSTGVEGEAPRKAGVLAVRSQRFATDVRRIQRAEADGLRQQDRQTYDQVEPVAPARFRCPPADWGRGRLLGVLYDGAPTVLAFRAPEGDSQVVELLRCGNGEILRSTTLPEP